MLLTDFPREVSCKIISEWLSFHSVCRLDSAFCTRSYQSELLALLASAETVLVYKPTEEGVLSEGFYAWLLLRKIKVNRLLIYGQMHATEIGRYLRITGAHVTSIKLQHMAENTFWIYGGLLLTHCSNIQHLYFDYCDFTDTFRDFLVKFPNLEELFLDRCSNLHRDSVHSVQCPSLRTLSIYKCDFGVDCTSELLMLSDSLLNLNVTGMEMAVLLDAKVFERNPGLQKLVLRSCDIHDAELTVIATCCPQLIELDLGDCTLTSENSVLIVATRCPNLRTLLIDLNSQLTDASILALAQHCPQLTHISIHDCNGISNNGIRTLLTSYTRLHTMYLVCTTVNIVKRLPKALKSLTIDSEVSDTVLIAIAGLCTNLQHLRLVDTKWNSAKGLAALARGCPALRTLVVPRNEALFNALAVEVWKVARPLVEIVRTDKLWSEYLLFAPDITG